MTAPLASFPSADVRLAVRVETRFRDGVVNRFDGDSCALSPDFMRAVAFAGYGTNWFQYVVEHELGHAWLATRMGWPHSWSLHGAATGEDGPYHGGPMSERVAAEEHLVVRLQRYVNTGEVDEDYGVLADTFGDELPAIAGELRKLWRRV